MRLAPCALLIALGTLLSLYLPDAVAGAGLVGYDIISGRGLSHGLFATIGDATTQPGLTQWPVTIDIGALGTLPISLRLNLPERAAVDLSRDRSEQRGSGRYLWTGHGGDCTAVLDNGFAGMTGVLSCLNANYKIGSGDGALQLTRYDPNPLGPPAPVEDTTDSGGGGELYGLQGQEQALSPLSDDVIDVLVLYQEPVRAALDPDGGRTHTYALAQLAIDTLQDAIDQSEADAAVQLVSAREVSRTTYGYLPDDLDWLRTDPEPLGLRNQWAADVIVYLTLSGGNAYGISTVPGSTAPPNPPVPPPGPGYAPDAQAVVQYNTAVFDETGGYPQEPYVFLTCPLPAVPVDSRYSPFTERGRTCARADSRRSRSSGLSNRSRQGWP